MKYSVTNRIFGAFYHGVCKNALKEKGVSKKQLEEIKKEYKNIVLKAKDIGKAQLISSYLMCAYFIALNRCDGLSCDENYECMKNGLMNSKIFHKIMGDADSYFDLKRTEKRKIWAKESHKKKYENDWVVDVLDKTDDYELGYNYTECGVCKLCRDENCPELAKYLCKLDFPIAEMMGMKLKRTKTLADGFDMCDFRYSKKSK